MILKKNFKSGFTLTETLIVIIIFVIVIVAVFSALTFSQQAYLEGENLAELTQNGRVVLERVTREIRQAREIATELPDIESSSSSEIEFHDGHISLVYATNTPQAVGTTTLTLSSDSSSTTDFYKDIFLEITSGWGNENNKIRKIISYDGATKVATLNNPWEDAKPTTASVYKIDSAYYYIHYFVSSTEILHEIKCYYFPSDPNTYLPWNATSTTETLTVRNLEEPREIGEFVENLKFWGSKVINISLTLKRYEKEINFKTKIFGRNL